MNTCMEVYRVCYTHAACMSGAPPCYTVIILYMVKQSSYSTPSVTAQVSQCIHSTGAKAERPATIRGGQHTLGG